MLRSSGPLTGALAAASLLQVGGFRLVLLALLRREESATDATAAVILSAAYDAHPERFVRKPPEPPKIPTNSWINPPPETEAMAQ